MSEGTLDPKFLKGGTLAKLLAPHPHRVFSFEGAAGRFGPREWAVRMITSESTSQAMREAAAVMQKAGWSEVQLVEGGAGWVHYNQEVKVQLLARALVSPTDPAAVLTTADDLRAALYDDEVNYLFEQYLAFKSERTPFAQAHSWEEVAEGVALLGKGQASTTFLLSFDSATLRFIVRELAVRWTTATRQLSSATTPQSDSNES